MSTVKSTGVVVSLANGTFPATSLNSGAAVTTTAGCLIFGYADALNYSVAAGSGFAQREASKFSAVSEDEIAISARSYAANFARGKGLF